MLQRQPLPIQWQNAAKDPHLCDIGRYFDRSGLHDTSFGVAHKEFHQVIDLFATDKVAWEAAAERLRCELRKAILVNHNALRCDAGDCAAAPDPASRCVCALALA